MNETSVAIKLVPEHSIIQSSSKFLDFFQSVLGNHETNPDFSENYKIFWEFTKRLQDAKIHPQKANLSQTLDFQSGKYRSPQTKIAKQFLQMMLAIQTTIKHKKSLNKEEIDQIVLFLLGQIDIHYNEKLLSYFTGGKYNLQDLNNCSFLYERFFVYQGNPISREFIIDSNQSLSGLDGLNFCMVYYQALRSFHLPAIASQLPDLPKQRNELNTLSINTLKKIIASYPNASLLE